MQNRTPDKHSVHSLERNLALVASAACVLVTLVIWQTVGLAQPTWPLPALYFLELIMVALVSAAAFWRRAVSSSHISWAATGIYLVFAVLSLFSVGLIYIFITLLFAWLAVVSTARHAIPWLPRLGVLLVAALGQAIIMAAIFRIIAAP